jgi:hypothetical protein
MTEIATMVYVRNVKESKFLDHLLRFKRSFPLIVVTDGPIPTVKLPYVIAPIPLLGPFTERVGNSKPSDQYAVWAFVYTFLAAKKRGVKYFLLLEEDCRISTDLFDKILWGEFMRWPTNALFGGTPVMWHPWCNGNEISKQVINYAYAYQTDSGLPMCLEGDFGVPQRQAFYPNGAIAIYSVSECEIIFKNMVEMLGTNASLLEKACAAQFVEAFDFYIGLYMMRKYGPRAFDLVAYLPSAYSGWGNNHVTLEQRKRMIATRSKVAVHHLKESEL